MGRQAGHRRVAGYLDYDAQALGNLSIAGNLSVAGTTALTGAVSLDGALSVDGTTTLNDDVGIFGDLALTGAVDAALGVTGQRVFYPEGLHDAGGPLVTTAGRAYAVYCGQAPRDFTAANLYAYVHGTAAVAGAGGAALNWAEVAIASGPKPTSMQASLNLTMLAYASIDTPARAGATVMTDSAVSSFAFTRGLGIWVIVAASYETTQLSMRFFDGADTLGFLRTRNACQPSLNINTPLAFTTTAPTGVTVPHLRCYL